MHNISNNVRAGLTCLSAAVLCLLPVRAVTAGPQIWEGNEIYFEKPSGSDWTLPQNQDRITDNVWITRGNIMGIFNIAQEPQFGGGSPADTEWAFVFNNPAETLTASNYQNLVFQNWQTATGNNPPGTVDQPAVVHLISDDIYINIMFVEWEAGQMPRLDRGGSPGGAFAYYRASGSVPTPGSAALLLLALGSVLPSRRRR
jgi:hypothetical protein